MGLGFRAEGFLYHSFLRNYVTCFICRLHILFLVRVQEKYTFRGLRSGLKCLDAGN